MNNRSKKLMTDVVMFSISNFGSKVLVFLLVPLYTATLSTEEYGIADLFSVSINLLLPLLTLAVTEATLRFLLDDESDKGKILAISLLTIGISFILVLIISPGIVRLYPEIRPYYILFLLTYLITALNDFFSNFIRGLDKTRVFAIKGVLYTVAVISFNILFLLILRIGLTGYLLAIIFAEVISIIYMLFAGEVWQYFGLLKIDFQLTKEMLKYSIPLMPTIISWWIMQMSDKYIIIAYSGLAVSGIYSIAYKIPSVLSVVSAIFNKAWQISSVKSSNDDDYPVFFRKVYLLYFVFCMTVCSILIVLSKALGYVLFANEYFIAWKYVPTLLVAYFFSGLSGVMASAFTTKKRTSVLFYSTLCGAALNLVLNFALIPKYGALAAAVTTLIGFCVTCLIRDICMRLFFRICVNGLREFIMCAVLLCEAVCVTLDMRRVYLIFILSTLLMLVAYRKEVLEIYLTLKRIVNSVRKKYFIKKSK